MRRITICLRPIQEHRGLGAEERGVMGSSKLPIFDLRLLGAIAVVLITVVTLSNPEPSAKTRWVADCPRRARSPGHVVRDIANELADCNNQHGWPRHCCGPPRLGGRSSDSSTIRDTPERWHSRPTADLSPPGESRRAFAFGT